MGAPARIRVDHAIIGCRDLAASSARLEAAGLRVVPGGDHPGRGTSNALIGLANGYLELIAYARPEETGPGAVRNSRVAELVTGAEAWVGFVLHADDMAHATSLLAGAPGIGAIAGRDADRRTPSGDLLRWTSAMGQEWEFGTDAPFLITWPDGSPSLDATAGDLVAVVVNSPEGRLPQILRRCGHAPRSEAGGAAFWDLDGGPTLVTVADDRAAGVVGAALRRPDAAPADVGPDDVAWLLGRPSTGAVTFTPRGGVEWVTT